MKRPNWLLLISLFLSSCAGSPVKKTLNLSECVSDGSALQCSGPDFATQHTMQYKDSYGWICRAPETDKAYWDACFLQRQVNGK